MLSLLNIRKVYQTGDFTQVALDSINLHFREKEFVAILGPSGSGKTTFLNVVGGLDRYTSGDLLINGQSTKKFTDRDWDSYRNNSVGFVFQNYNLIPHLSVLDNVELGMTLSGVSAKERRKKALDVLQRVGLADHVNKRPNQLSGGQMQRVAIARALVNDPDIILADEPTGALDSKTSVQILELIKEIAKDKLVIMVTHNAELAERYADRIIRFKDGQVIADSHPLDELGTNKPYTLKRTSMKFFTALKLSFNNIWTKKGRTFLTAFASSIGIIFIAIVLAISNGFNKKIEEYEYGALSTFPITITQSTMELDDETIKELRKEGHGKSDEEKTYPDVDEVYPYERVEEKITHENHIDENYVRYLENMNPEWVVGIQYVRAVRMNLLKKDGDTATLVDTSRGFTSFPKSLDGDAPDYLMEHYDVLAGKYPEKWNELVLVVDEQNRIDKKVLENFGLLTDEEAISFDEIIGKEFRIVLNDDLYEERNGFFTINGNPDHLTDLYNMDSSLPIEVVGVLRPKKTVEFPVLQPGFVYSDELATKIIEDAQNSAIVKAQKDAEYNVLTGEAFDLTQEEGKKQREMILAALGASEVPQMISIYPRNFEAKDQVLSYLDDYNTGKADEEKIIYNDLAQTITEMSGRILNGITVVLVSFSAISLIVSVIMVGIITYISVLERTKEIGILRSLGAREKDITRVFNAETFIIGLSSGILGILIAYLALPSLNQLLERFTDLADIAALHPAHAVTLIIVSLTLTVLGGFIPAKIAAKKDPVEALRTE